MSLITPSQILAAHEPLEKKVVALKPLSKPDLSTLTTKQHDYCEELEAKVMGEISQSISVLTGGGGVGKTFTLNLLIQSLLWRFRGSDLKIVVTAPTHKALKVLRERCNIQSNNLDFMTVQSLLGLKEKKTLDGNIIFEQVAGKEKIGAYYIVITDEASMVDTILEGLISTEVQKRAVHVIYSGDPNQLNPVNEEDSPVFIKGYPTYALTEIIRQSADNPLMKLINNTNQYNFKKGEVLGVKGWEVIEKQQLLDYAVELFKSEHFIKNADFARVICWTNKAVDYINDYVRGKLFGENLARYVVGERLIVRDPYVVNDEILLHNNDEVEVMDIKLDTVKIYEEDYAVYRLSLKAHDNRNNVKIIEAIALHESSDAQLLFTMKTLADAAHEMAKGDYRKADLWQAFYGLKEMFASLRPLYAITVHNAQGSTFTNSLVTMGNLNENRNLKEKKRLIYTALTRASHFVYITK